MIDADVEIAPDTVIEPYVQLLGKTKIGADCRVRSYCVIRDSEIGDGVTVRPGCVMEDARIGRGSDYRPVFPSSPGKRDWRRRARRKFRRDQEDQAGQGIEGESPHVPGRRRDRRRRQHRRGHHHVQLRWRTQAQDGDRGRRLHRQRQHAGRAGARRARARTSRRRPVSRTTFRRMHWRSAAVAQVVKEGWDARSELSAQNLSANLENEKAPESSSGAVLYTRETEFLVRHSREQFRVHQRLELLVVGFEVHLHV